MNFYNNYNIYFFSKKIIFRKSKKKDFKNIIIKRLKVKLMLIS